MQCLVTFPAAPCWAWAAWLTLLSLGCLLQQLIKEKVDLENRLETEQEYVVNKLCKQVGRL